MPSSSAAGSGLRVHPFRALTYAARSPEQLARVSSPPTTWSPLRAGAGWPRPTRTTSSG
ncbi:hypothetical protein ACFQX8_06795 [Klenkia terrae]|uniref:hypothetical protein n=1 Tax=Klenkia terrae TaxID=1052259 RepID=UPI003620618F